MESAKPGETVTEQDVINYREECFTSHKLPRRVEIIQGLFLTARHGGAQGAESGKGRKGREG